MPHYRHTQIGWGMMAGSLIPISIALTLLARAGATGVALAVFLFLVVVFLTFCALTVTVDLASVGVRFGVGWVWRRVPFADIAAYRRVRSAWWRGLGIRYIGRGWLYSVSGFRTVELTLKNGKRVRIGTDEPEALAAALEQALGRPEAPAG